MHGTTGKVLGRVLKVIGFKNNLKFKFKVHGEGAIGVTGQVGWVEV